MAIELQVNQQEQIRPCPIFLWVHYNTYLVT